MGFPSQLFCSRDFFGNYIFSCTGREFFEKMIVLFQQESNTEVLKYLCALFLFGFILMLWFNKLYFSRFHSHPHSSGAHHSHPMIPTDQLQEINQKKKSNSAIEIPLTLTLNCLGEENKEITSTYRLTSVLMHLGATPFGGHYIAHLLDTESLNWY